MAKKPATVTEADLDQLFREDPKFGVQKLDSEYRENIWRYIRSVCRYLDPDDIHDVYQKTLGELIKCVQKPGFYADGVLKLVQRIAKCRAIDCARRKGTARTKSAGELIGLLAVDLKDTKLGLESRLILLEEAPKFRQALDKAVDELPDKQRTAALAFLEVYEEMRLLKSPKPLAERIRQMTGEDCTTAQAADRWREAKTKLEAKLTRAGFRSLFEEYQ